MPAIIDLNAAFLSHALTAQPSFVSAAGHVGPHARVDHDVSLLVPEVLARMAPDEREAAFLIAHGYLEKCEDIEWNGRRILASRLGFRITAKFARVFFGRVFTHPHSVLTNEMLRPETQDMEMFADGMDNVCATHQRVAQSCLDDGTIEMACPPLRALLMIMATGEFEGMGLDSPELRAMFTRDFVLWSDWYAERLRAKQQRDCLQWTKHIATLERAVVDPDNAVAVAVLGLADRLAAAKAEAARIAGPAYFTSLVGTLGLQPL